MSARNDGGQAFPVSVAYSPHSGMVNGFTGMTLRDWFAGQALAGLLAFPGTLHGSPNKTPKALASAAYDIADAMLLEQKIAR